MKVFKFNLDALGMCASSLCMVHCLAFPVLLTVLPMWSLASEKDESIAATAQYQTVELTAASVSAPPLHDCCKDESCTAAATQGTKETAACSQRCCATPTDFWIHTGMLATVAPLGLVAWLVGYREHRRPGVIWLGLAGPCCSAER